MGKKVCHTGVKTEENPSISCLCANDDYLFTAAFDYKVHCWDIKVHIGGQRALHNDLSPCYSKDGLLSKFADPKFDSIPQVHVLSTFTNTVLCMKVHPTLCLRIVKSSFPLRSMKIICTVEVQTALYRSTESR